MSTHSRAHPRRLASLAAWSTLAAILLLACTTASPPSSAAPASRAGATAAATQPNQSSVTGAAPAAPTAAPLKKIAVGMSSAGLTYLQHRIAQVKGFYQQAGFDAELQIIPQNTLLTGIIAGEIAFGDSGGSAVRAAASGLPVRLVSCHGIRPLYILVLAPGLRSGQDLNDKAVAINALGSDTHIIGADLIRKYGGDPSRVEYFPLGASSVRYAAVESGRVAGGIVTTTEAILARESGLAVLSTIEDLPLACNAGTVVAQAAIAERRQDVQQFLRAVEQAVRFMLTVRGESARIFAEWVGIDERQAEATYDESQVTFSWSNDRRPAEQAIETAIAFAKEAGQIDAAVRLTDVADLSFYP